MNDRARRLGNRLQSKNKMATKRNGGGNLETALAQLLQNQAQFVLHLDQDRQRRTRIEEQDRQRFARIEKDLDLIKALLIKHEDILQKLPEVIREKIGFKPG